MDDLQRLHLSKMIKENNVVDQTNLIRKLKHSMILKENVNTLLDLKATCSIEDLNQLAMDKCSFLFTYYTDIYNKIKKDEIDLEILFQLIDILEEIEEERVDQHEGSFKVGTLLKKIYVDSALKKAEKLDKLYGTEQEEKKIAQEISWKEFKIKNKI